MSLIFIRMMLPRPVEGNLPQYPQGRLVLLRVVEDPTDRDRVIGPVRREPDPVVGGVRSRVRLDTVAVGHDQFTRAIERGADDADVYFGRGTARLDQGKGEAAEEDFPAVIARGRDDAEVHDRLGQARLRRDESAGAAAGREELVGVYQAATT
jgi:hypothetical protein